jgi:hypothetical protein
MNEEPTDPLAVIKVTFEKIPFEMMSFLNILSFMLVSVTLFMYMYVGNQVVQKIRQTREHNYVHLTT